MASELSYIPQDLQLMTAYQTHLERKPVCKIAYKFLKHFYIVKIDKKNPVL